MVAVTVFVLCSLVVVARGDRIQVSLEADRPSLRVQFSHTAKLQCCYRTSGGAVDRAWISSMVNRTLILWGVDQSDLRVTTNGEQTANGVWCGFLTIREARLNDSGLYQCYLKHSALKPSVYTHGTFLQVYKPKEKTLNISESTKNKILIAQGILLLLCMLLPGALLMCKSKRINRLEKMKKRKEEENIYEGLNLEDCCTTYDQIQRSRVQGPYQDVRNVVVVEEEEGEIQFEKP